MMRRLARSILVMVWATLIAGGAVAYITTRSVLLADLDASLIARAQSLGKLSNTNEFAPRLEEAAGDRYVISNDLTQTRDRLVDSPNPAARPTLRHASLARLGIGHLVQKISTLRFTSRTSGEPITVVFTGSADGVYRVLRELALALWIFGLAAGILAAGAAVVVSRAVCRPLLLTADTIGTIDERQLDRRIEVLALPSELQPVARHLNEMLARLDQAFSQRKQFLADASHELRTPVAALIMTIEVALRRPRDSSELSAALRTCLSDARMLRQLVQTLMDLARAETRQADEKYQRFDALDVLNQCLDVADGLALEKEIIVHRELPAELNLCSKPLRLRGIVMNLLSNAIAYNRAGGTVELSAELIGADLNINISDTGRGIAASHLPHIFQPFYRAPGSRREEAESDQPTHLGLGLYLVDSHVKSMGGECRIDSQSGIGTTVTVVLPDVAAPEPAILEGAAI